MKTDLTPMPIDAVPRDPSRRTAPVRVLYLMEGFEAGGAERRFVRMARGLDSNRFALTIAALRLGGPLEAEMRVSGVPVVPFERRSRFDITPALRLRRFLRAERIQVVHAMHWLSNLIATLAASTLPRVAVVGSTVGMVYTASRGGRYRLALDRSLTWRRLDRMTVNSVSLREYLISCGFPHSRLAVVPNGVDLPDSGRIAIARAEARERLGINPAAPTAGIVARLSPVKDHDTFLHAARHVHERLPDARFVIAGDGPERSRLQALADALGLGTSVIFTGHVPSSDLVLPAFDVAALSSRHEGLPNALLEAGAWALPAVATAVGGVPEAVLDGHTGLLAPAGDAVALAQHILALLTNRDRAERMGAAARTHIAANYSTSSMIRQYEDMYSAAAASRSK